MNLNKIEWLKQACRPYDFQNRLAELDLEHLSEADRFYLKNYGIYNSKLRPEHFMLRLRIDGGRISVDRLEYIAKTAVEYGARVIMTARAQMELHGLTADNVLSVWQDLNEAGVGTLQVLTDNFRAIVTDPLDGVAQSSRMEVYGLIVKMQQMVIDNPEWMGMLPRKFNTAICATAATHTHFYGNDLYFALAHKEGEWGFNLYLGGKNSHTAQPADLFVLPEDVPKMFLAVAEVYRHDGLRQSRARTRLYNLIEEVGMDAVRSKIIQRCQCAVASAGETVTDKAPFSSVIPLKEGGYACCVPSRYGSMDAQMLALVAAFAKREGLEARLGIDQNLYLVGLKSEKNPFAAVPAAAQVTACAGSRYCALSLWDIKDDTAYLPLGRIAKHQIEIGFSGCLKGCGRHHHCDIGIVGLRTNAYGTTQKAARIFLGGQYTDGSMPTRLIFPSVPLVHLHRVIDVIIDVYEQSGEADFEIFCSRWLNGLSSDFVLLWLLAQCYLDTPPTLERSDETTLYARLKATPGFETVASEDDSYMPAIKAMMHALWDD